MRHIITGGSGFTAGALTQLLVDRKEEVILFDLLPPKNFYAESVRFIQGDVTRAEDLRQLGLRGGDVVYHLAARQFANGVPRANRNAWFDEVNIAGTAAVVAVMQSGGADRLVYFSTDMTYGLPHIVPVPPNHPQEPLGPYGRSKKAAERILREAEGIRATIFRPRLITGPGRLGILAQLFELISVGLPVPMIGSGRNRYQMVGVTDCARAALIAAEAGCPAGPFNLGSAEPPTTRDLLLAIIRHADSHSLLLRTPASAVKAMLAMLDRVGLTLLYPEQFRIADADIVLDTTSTRDELGWRPEHDDIEMMCRAYDGFINGS
jgi:nucleoside-diphosphate-sugar epimerase